jgi:hypothetical protein
LRVGCLDSEVLRKQIPARFLSTIVPLRAHYYRLLHNSSNLQQLIATVSYLLDVVLRNARNPISNPGTSTIFVA